MNTIRTNYLKNIAKSYAKVGNMDPETYVREVATRYLQCLRSEMFDSVFKDKKEGETTANEVSDCTKAAKKLDFTDLITTYFEDFSSIIHQTRTDLSDDFIKIALT